MMSIDEVSHAIGELKAEAIDSQNQRRALFDKVDDIGDKIAELKTIVQTSITAHAATLDVHGEKLTRHHEDIRNLKKFRRNIYLGIATVGGTGGITGAILTKLGLK